MNSLARNTIKVGVVSAAGILLAGSAAQAGGENWSTSQNTGIGNGIQAYAPIQIPINLCGNAISLLGSASAWCQGGSKAIIEDEESPVPGPAPYGHSGRKPAAHHAAHRPATKPSAVMHKHHNKRKIEGMPLIGDGLTGLTDGLRSVLTCTLGQTPALPMDALIGEAPAASRHGGDHCSLNWFTSC